MWAKNLLFVTLCLAALTGLAASLMNRGDSSVEVIAHVEARSESVAAVSAQVDREFAADWEERGLDVADPADRTIVMRRLALGLMGTIPSLEEIRLFEQVEPDRRLDWWVSHLLQDRRYSDYVAERFARAYVGTEGGPFLVYRRRRFVSWLSDELYGNVPYDELVRKLISDDGLWTDSPAVNFVSVTLDQNNDNQPDPIRLAGRTSRAFLGMRIDCLQCHDDFLGNIHLGTSEDPRSGRQTDFHQLAAFFGGAESSLFGISDGKEEYQYKYLDADEEEMVDAQPPFLPDLLPDEGTRRQRLAKWVTHSHNRSFARATVNRVWAVMFGRPLVEPIDDIPWHGDLPPGMETLATDFVKHGYDLQRLIRVIAGTRVYQLDSRAEFEVTEEHEAAWTVFPLTRLRPEQVAGATIQSASLTTIDANSHIVWKLARFGNQNDFIRRYGDTGEDEFDQRAGTISQRLLLMNGNLVREKTAPNPIQNASSRIAILSPTDEKAIEIAYLAVLTRQPSRVELEHFAKKLADERGRDRQVQIEDLYWVLINGTEFTWNH